MSSRIDLHESRRLGASVFLHLGSAFLWELDRGRGLNEIRHTFPCNKSPVHIPTGQTRSGEFVVAKYQIRYNASEMRGRGLKMVRKAQVIKGGTLYIVPSQSVIRAIRI